MRMARMASRSEVEVNEEEDWRFLIRVEMTAEGEQRTRVEEARQWMRWRKVIAKEEDRLLHSFNTSMFVFCVSSSCFLL